MSEDGTRYDEKYELRDALEDALRAEMVRVAPDAHAWVPREGESAARYVMCRWAKKGAQGHYLPVPVSGRLVRVGADLLALLGFNSGQRRSRYETLYRLNRAGFIDMVKISPGCWMLDLDSWYRHLGTCMDNPEMWDEGSEELDTYLRMNGLGGWKNKE